MEDVIYALALFGRVVAIPHARTANVASGPRVSPGPAWSAVILVRTTDPQAAMTRTTATAAALHALLERRAHARDVPDLDAPLA